MTEKLIIIGGGISANTAAIYAARAGLSPLVIASSSPDQLSMAQKVENWPGALNGIKGRELIEGSKKQAQKFGARYLLEKVISFKPLKGSFEIATDNKTYTALSSIICTGASPKFLDIGEKKFLGRGLSTCATCDAVFYKDKTAVVVGGGDHAMESVLELSKFAQKIYLIHRRDEFRASKILQERISKVKNLEILFNTVILEVQGANSIASIKIKNLKSNKASILNTEGVFLAIGHIPNTEIFKKSLKLDPNGFIITDKNTETSLKGVFAAGDCQDPTFNQAITAAGSGCKAAIMAVKYLGSLN